jgi:hypothetical protein
MRWENYPEELSQKEHTEMEIRNGVHTSQTRKSDAEDIERLAKQLLTETNLDVIRVGLEKIKRIARDLAGDL